MRNFFKPLTETSEFKCKSKTVIKVNSDRYNADKAYQNKIDFMLDRAYLSK